MKKIVLTIFTLTLIFSCKTNQENKVLFTEASNVEIEQAVTLATEAFVSFRKISGVKKSDFLNI